MATFTEAGVRVSVTLRRRMNGDLKVVTDVQSFAEDGTVVRTENFDITSLLSDTQRTNAGNFLDMITTKVKERWGIQ